MSIYMWRDVIAPNSIETGTYHLPNYGTIDTHVVSHETANYIYISCLLRAISSGGQQNYLFCGAIANGGNTWVATHNIQDPVSASYWYNANGNDELKMVNGNFHINVGISYYVSGQSTQYKSLGAIFDTASETWSTNNLQGTPTDIGDQGLYSASVVLVDNQYNYKIVFTKN